MAAQPLLGAVDARLGRAVAHADRLGRVGERDLLEQHERHEPRIRLRQLAQGRADRARCVHPREPVARDVGGVGRIRPKRDVRDEPLVAADAAGGTEDRDPNAHAEFNRSSVAADEKPTEPSSDLPTIPLGSTELQLKLTRPPGGRTELETIVVTATKRPSAADSLPASVGYISGEALESAGASELRDFLTRIPGVQQTEVFPEFNRISIRGVQSDTAAVTSAATGFFIEEVPFSGPFVLHARPDLPPFDLEAVEVLKGPQGTLFGASALAGALRYRVMDAEPGHWGAHGFMQYQSPEDGSANHSVGVAANVPIGNDAAVRVVGTSRFVGGRIDDLRNGMSDTDKAHRQSGRVLWRWEPASQRWSLGLKAFVHGVDADDLPLAETTNGRFERERALRNAPMNSRAKLAAFDMKYRANWADIVLVSSVIDTQSYLSGRDGARALAIEDAGQPAATPTREDIQGYVQEVRLVSPSHDSSWTWLVGAYAHQYSDFSTQRVVVEAGNRQAGDWFADCAAFATPSEGVMVFEMGGCGMNSLAVGSFDPGTFSGG